MWPFSKNPEPLQPVPPLDCDFDFSGMRAYAIERNGNQTVIGHLNKDSLEEWWMVTSEEVHNRLVAQFREYIKTRDEKQAAQEKKWMKSCNCSCDGVVE